MKNNVTSWKDVTLTLHQNFLFRQFLHEIINHCNLTFWVILYCTYWWRQRQFQTLVNAFFSKSILSKMSSSTFGATFCTRSRSSYLILHRTKKEGGIKNMNSNLTLSSNTTPKLCGTCFKTNFSSMAHTTAILCCIKCQINLIMGMKQPQFLCNKWIE